ncbi:MAG: M61 family metallopeptidase [Caldimonas sp.]
MITSRIDATDVHAHRYRVTLTVPEPAAEQRFSLPVWIPGSYLVREFARHLSELSARQDGLEVPLVQLDKATWSARTGERRGALTVSYCIYAFDTSVRAAFLDANRGFFNGTSLMLRVEGREDRPHRIELSSLPEGWQVATALAPVQIDAAGRGTYRAADYDELVDHPVELGRFWRGAFTAAGVPHEFVVAGALPDFDGDRLLADTARICAAQIAFWHGAGAGAAKPPFGRYLFMLNAVEDGHGGLEHRASTALIAARRDLPRREAATGAEQAEPSDGYVNTLGLVSHEYFHAWNVKRLRPRDFERYDYARENYTELLWFFEGFTSYYDDLFLRRSGLIDEGRYLKLMARTMTNVAATPGRLAQSVAQASFDAWIKFYRGDENTLNATISYYAKGALVALALDLTLRAEGKGSLDDVLRLLWARSAGGPIGEADIAAALETIGARSYAGELAAWVHGIGELPLRSLLEAAAVEWQAGTPTLAQRLGVRVAESALTGVKVTHVLRDGAAERAGVAAGDEILAWAGWRLRRLDDAARLAAPGVAVPVLVARDQRVVELALALPEEAPGGGAVNLKPAAKPSPVALALNKAWLAG